MKLLFVLLAVYVTAGNCAAIIAHVDCDPAVPAVAPVLAHPFVNHLYGLGPIVPAAPAPEAAPAAEAAPADLPVYHKGFYGGLAPLAHPWGLWNHADCDHTNWGHLGYGAWGLNHGIHGHGAIATGPVDINGDGAAYTGHEDDRSPIAGGHVYQALQGATTWHGPHYGALAHLPVGPYGSHHGWQHYPWGYWGHHTATPVPVAKIPEGQEMNGPLYGHYFHGYPHGGAYGWNHALPSYTIGDIKNVEIKKEDCPEGVVLPHVVFDKSVKPVEAEAVAVADEAPEAAEAAPAS